MRKALLTLVGVLVVLAVGYGGWRLWLGWHDAQVRATAALEARDSANAERDAALAASETARKELEKAHSAARAALGQANRATAERDSALQHTVARVDTALRRELTPEQQVMLDSLQATWAARLAGSDSVSTRTALALRDVLTDLDACNRAVEQAIEGREAWRLQAEAWKRRSQPGFFKKLVGWIPPFLAGGAVVAIGAVVSGAGS